MHDTFTVLNDTDYCQINFYANGHPITLNMGVFDKNPETHSYFDYVGNNVCMSFRDFYKYTISAKLKYTDGSWSNHIIAQDTAESKNKYFDCHYLNAFTNIEEYTKFKVYPHSTKTLVRLYECDKNGENKNLKSTKLYKTNDDKLIDVDITDGFDKITKPSEGQKKYLFIRIDYLDSPKYPKRFGAYWNNIAEIRGGDIIEPNENE